MFKMLNRLTLDNSSTFGMAGFAFAMSKFFPLAFFNSEKLH